MSIDCPQVKFSKRYFPNLVNNIPYKETLKVFLTSAASSSAGSCDFFEDKKIEDSFVKHL